MIAALATLPGAIAQTNPTAPAAATPSGQGRIYFDAATNTVKVSENGAPFVTLVGATGVPQRVNLRRSAVKLAADGWAAFEEANRDA